MSPRFAPAEVQVTWRADGSLVLRSPHALAAPPSIDAGEITDKGYINQRVVLDRRHAWVARLYGADDPAVIALS